MPTRCDERGWHRFVIQDPHGPDVDESDWCFDCGEPRLPVLHPDQCVLFTGSDR